VTHNRTKFRERVLRVPASRHRSFRAGKCILANMTSFSGTELSLRKQIGISGVRAASLSIIFFSILFRHGITDVTLHCNFCVHRFIYDSVRSCRLHDLSTRRGRRREREKEGGKEKEREKSFRYPFLTPAIKMLLPPSNKYLFTSCYIFHLTAFD